MEDALQGILLLGLMAFVTNGIAHRLGFFRLLSFTRPPVHLIHLAAVFGIYLGYLFVLPPFLKLLVLDSSTTFFSVQSLMTLQFLIVMSMFATLFLYIRTEKHGVFKIAFKNPQSSTTRSWDFGVGLMAWFVVFPWVAIISQVCDFVLLRLFQFESYEQVAVRYLKDNLDSPFQMVIALVSVVLIAPIVEEILFRATLQQYLKKFFTIRVSIGVTALVFACFHFSSVQDLGNFSLIPSLFVLACFLGYLYERHGSIYSSIGLHVGFNLASSLQIVFFQDS